MAGLNRRQLLLGGLATVAVTTVPAVAPTGVPAVAPAGGRAVAAGRRALPTDPFTLGVASGDPDHEGFVIWTRLAVRPLAEDGFGGMPDRAHTVEWEIAEDDRLTRIVRRGTAEAAPSWGHTVHVELSGLLPDREYWYRFRTGRYVSPAGRARTAPRPDALGGALAMAFASCAQYEHGYFTAYRRLAEDHPDVVLHLGDYQYEYRAGVYTAAGGNPRDHAGPETGTLATYRQRHAQYKTDPDLRAAHAAAPWVVVWDDHEVANDWAGGVPDRPDVLPPGFAERRRAAFRAYYENMPLRRTSVPRGVDLRLYRRIRWGRLATLHMLDTRQYRDDQACGNGWQVCPAAAAPGRTITGPEQERWLLDGLRRSDARWDLLGQQVFFAKRDTLDGPDERLSMDAWDGYSANRDRIIRGWVDAGVRNAVVLTGDVHTHWAADLKLDFDDPHAPAVGAELVCSSVTSGGDGADTNPADHPTVRLNPHIKFVNPQRGYVRTTVTPDSITADFRVVPVVSWPGAPAYTRATFVVADRVPGLRQTYDRPIGPSADT